MTASENVALDPVCSEFCGLPIDDERDRCPALDEALSPYDAVVSQYEPSIADDVGSL